MLVAELWITLLSIQSAYFVRIDLTNANTSQSQTFSNSISSLAIDGNKDTCSISEQNSTIDDHPWWRVELERIYNITDLSLHFSYNGSYAVFMNNLKVYISINESNFEQNLCQSFKKLINSSVEDILINCTKPSAGRFVTIKRIGGPKKNTLVLCEVRLNADLKSINLAYKRPTEHSGIYFTSKTTYPVDNDFETCEAIRAYYVKFAWWRVFLDRSYYITNVNLYFNPDMTGSKAKSLIVFVSNDDDHYEEHTCGNTEPPNNTLDNNNFIRISCYRPILGAYVTVKNFGGEKPRLLILCEVEIFTKDEPRQMKKSEVFEDCHAHEYKCYNGRCIHKDWLCDGTTDCVYGDDEAPSCQKCGKGKFKCTRRNVCVNNAKRCDGKADCPDYSDEYGCFKIEPITDYLTATFKGESDYYICSHNWKIIYSHTVCVQFQRIYYNTTYQSMQGKTFKLLTLKKSNTSEGELPDMKYFRKDSKCKSEKFVKVKCEYIGRVEPTGICGTRGYPDGYFEPYIINGDDAKNGSWPWQVQVIVDDDYACGGSIINENWILTAAHCTGSRPKVIHIKVGTHIFNDPYAVEYEATHVTKHPNYVEGYHDSGNDIALIKLNSPIIFNNYVRPVCLPERVLDNRTLMSYRHCVITGYGIIDTNETETYLLQQGRMNIISDEDCSNYLAEISPSTSSSLLKMLKKDNLMCAGSIPTKEGINACLGDSGGPFVCKNEQRIWTQIGLIKSSVKDKKNEICTNTLTTKVDHYLQFIQFAFDMKLEPTPPEDP